MRRSFPVLIFFLAALFAARSAAKDPLSALFAAESKESRSIGGPLDGSLERSIAFPDQGPGFRKTTRRPEARYGTVEAVRGVVRAAMKVDELHPGGELLVNDLSLERGGPINRHESHRAGRDVDVLFYLLDAEGKPTRSVAAILDPAGEGVDFRDPADPSDDFPVRLDVARTFRFLEALALDEEARLQRVFIAEHLRKLILAYGEREGGDKKALSRLDMMMCQPGTPHDDHLHLRFFCSADDLREGCEDAAPIYPYQRAYLRALGLKPKMNRPRPDRPRSRTVSVEEARAAAGPLHKDVISFLERRNEWIHPPKTGRPYCR